MGGSSASGCGGIDMDFGSRSRGRLTVASGKTYIDVANGGSASHLVGVGGGGRWDVVLVMVVAA